jgi:serine/threonine protein kinase
MNRPSTNDFLGLALKSGVLDEKQFAERFPDESDWPTDPKEFAQALVKAGLLTQFQARELLAGKSRGFILGPYKILRPLGRGGMGAVYLAEHTSLRRQVALKVLPVVKAKNPLMVERFFREARAAAALDHPNIVRLHDVNQGAGVHFLVMEYVEGKDLQSLVNETGPLHFSQAVHYITQAAAGLQHAHEKGFVHRDIKPGNLILTKDATVKILDLGLARSFQDDVDDLTAQLGGGQVTGTVHFISPEQALGNQVDERSDIYSLGATLYALITGNPPFKGETTQVMMQHQTAALPQLSKKLRGSVPQALYDLIGKMMAKKKGDRPQSCAEVIEALSPWLPAPPSGNVVQDRLSTRDLPTAKAPSTRSRRRRRKAEEVSAPSQKTKLWIGGGAAALALVLVIWLVIAAFRGTEAPPTNRAPAAGPAGPAPATLIENEGTLVKLIQGETGKVLSVADGAEVSGNRAVVAEPNDKDLAQQWRLKEDSPRYYKLINRKSGLALDVNQDSKDEDAQIIQWTIKRGGGENQLWSWDGEGLERRLMSKSSGLVLAMDEEGKAIQKRADENSRRQRWRVVEIKK